MTKKTPWQEDGNPWHNEAKFITWIRGVLRKGWSKHPLKLEYIKRNRKRIKNPNPKASVRFPEVWGMTCEQCGKDHLQANIEIDHRGEQGTFTTMSEIENYARHLFMITYEDIRAVCTQCHKAISYSQKSGMSFEDSVLEKKVIQYIKDHSTQEIVDFLKRYKYNDNLVSNATKRRKALTEIFKGEANEGITKKV